MTNEQLEHEAAKWNIKGYSYPSGNIDRQIIIDALLKRDSANESRIALVISFIALVVSILVLFLR